MFMDKVGLFVYMPKHFLAMLRDELGRRRAEISISALKRLFRDLQLSSLSIDITQLVIFKWRVELPVTEAGVVAFIDGLQQPDFRVARAFARYVEEVDFSIGAVVDHQPCGVAQV